MLHYSWFLIAMLLTLSQAGPFQATQPQWGVLAHGHAVAPKYPLAARP